MTHFGVMPMKGATEPELREAMGRLINWIDLNKEDFGMRPAPGSLPHHLHARGEQHSRQIINRN
jgi:hypothetical protein